MGRGRESSRFIIAFRFFLRLTTDILLTLLLSIPRRDTSLVQDRILFFLPSRKLPFSRNLTSLQQPPRLLPTLPTQLSIPSIQPPPLSKPTTLTQEDPLQYPSHRLSLPSLSSQHPSRTILSAPVSSLTSLRNHSASYPSSRRVSYSSELPLDYGSSIRHSRVEAVRGVFGREWE